MRTALGEQTLMIWKDVVRLKQCGYSYSDNLNVIYNTMENVNGVSDLKEELKSLYEKKRLLEEKVNECLDRLQSSGVGLEGSLVDSEV